MRIDDFLDYCSDAGMVRVEIFDFDSGKVVFKGWGDDIPEDLLYEDISSWDPPERSGVITININ